uniref:Uncharacterized protein LOC107073609 n=1 Tax=Polistes dominula TaxID=743375 RepID=A0ABM1JBE7_POLDO
MARSGFQLIQYFAVFIVFLNDCSANGIKEWSTLPVYGMLANAELLNSTKCGKELTEFRQAIDKRILWSLRVIDASGRPTSGFIYGNNYWFGSKDQCEDVENRNPLSLSKEVLQNNSKYRPIEDEFPPFEVKYFVANIRHNSTMQYHIVVDNEDLIVLGMCLPASCSKDQLFTLLEISLKDGTILQDELYLAHFSLVE